VTSAMLATSKARREVLSKFAADLPSRSWLCDRAAGGYDSSTQLTSVKRPQQLQPSQSKMTAMVAKYAPGAVAW
jgi:hypothetical protein